MLSLVFVNLKNTLLFNFYLKYSNNLEDYVDILFRAVYYVNKVNSCG
jgi:hypothetical protein